MSQEYRHTINTSGWWWMPQNYPDGDVHGIHTDLGLVMTMNPFLARVLRTTAPRYFRDSTHIQVYIALHTSPSIFQFEPLPHARAIRTIISRKRSLDHNRRQAQRTGNSLELRYNIVRYSMSFGKSQKFSNKQYQQCEWAWSKSCFA